MKKILLILLSLLMLSACQQEEIPNPVKKYDSLEEINKIADVHIVSFNVEGINNEEYYIVENNTASYIFTLNGVDYYMRAVRDTKNDMSGLFVDGHPAFEGCEEKIAYKSNEKYKAYRFILDSTQYVFVTQDFNKISEDEFTNQFNEVYKNIILDITNNETKQLIGTYQDLTSMRATATIELYDVNTLKIDVVWPSSVNEYDEWIINAKVKDSKIEYNEIQHFIDKSDDNNYASQEEWVPGCFEITDNKLYWTGSGIELTSTCVFEKIN